MNDFNRDFGIDIQKNKGKKIAESSNHSHPYYELIYVRSGNFKYFIKNSLVSVESKNVILVDKNTIHKAIITNNVTNTYLNIKFYDNLIDGKIKEECTDLFRQKHIVIDNNNFLLIDLLFSKMYHEFDNKEKNWQILVRYQLGELITMLNRISKSTSNTGNHSVTDKHSVADSHSVQTTIEKIIDYINTKISIEHEADPDLETISKKFSISPSYISRIFKKQIGMGFKEYIISLKISNAKKLMNSEDLSITEIAYHSGFSDSNYFSTVFKKNEGISPTEYMNLLKKNNIFKRN